MEQEPVLRNSFENQETEALRNQVSLLVTKYHILKGEERKQAADSLAEMGVDITKYDFDEHLASEIVTEILTKLERK